MKKTLKLIPAIAMLLISAVLVSTSTYAWFSMNTTVSATGMQVKATTSSSLAIAEAKPVGTETSYTFNASAVALTPTTYDSGAGSYKLKYITNNSEVDAATGKAASYTYANVVTAEGYFKDYIVYIAASGTEMTGKKLNAEVTFGTATTTQKAVSIGFYIEDSYIGKVAEGEGAHTIQLSNSLNIPLNTTGNAVKVTMRFYIDGALEASANVGKEITSGTWADSDTTTYYTDAACTTQKTGLNNGDSLVGLYILQIAAGNCYVNTNTVNMNALTATVNFTAAD